MFLIILVECFNWASYVQDSDCIKLSLLNNFWATTENLTDMDLPKMKSLLVQKLSWYYDGKIHSQTDLNMREEIAPKGILPAFI